MVHGLGECQIVHGLESGGRGGCQATHGLPPSLQRGVKCVKAGYKA